MGNYEHSWCKHLCTAFLYGCRCLTPLDKYQGAQLLDHVRAELSYKVVVHICVPIATNESSAPHPHPHLVVSVLQIPAVLLGVQWPLAVVTCIS